MATLRQLKTFIVTAEYKKMSDAAKHLYISQPTVSQTISDLEKEYKTILFERNGKELHITPAGTLLLKSAREIIAIHDQLEQNMKNVNSVRPLRIGATITIGNNLIGPLVAQLKEIYPDIDPLVYINNTSHIEKCLMNNEMDIALVEGIISRPEISTSPVFTDKLYLIYGKNHPFASYDKITLDDLRQQSYILRESGSGTRAIFESVMKRNCIPFKSQWECSSSKSIIDAVKRGFGLGFISERCITKELENQEIFICPLEEISITRYFYLCYSNFHQISSQMKDFTDLIQQQSDCLLKNKCCQ